MFFTNPMFMSPPLPSVLRHPFADGPVFRTRAAALSPFYWGSLFEFYGILAPWQGLKWSNKIKANVEPTALGSSGQRPTDSSFPNPQGFFQS